MRIDPEDTIGDYPALLVRKVLRHLRNAFEWGKPELEAAAALSPGSGDALAAALRSEGLIEAAGPGKWTVTQAGLTLAAATAAKPVTRATAERALSEFLGRVTRVNQDAYFLSKVTRVVLFGSMLRPEVERLSDVDLAVELTPKEADCDRALAQNEQRAEEMENAGHHFRHFLERMCCGQLETFRFLKGRSRVISLADYKVEKAFVDAVPHRVIAGAREEAPADSAWNAPQLPRRLRPPRGCPF